MHYTVQQCQSNIRKNWLFTLILICWVQIWLRNFTSYLSFKENCNENFSFSQLKNKHHLVNADGMGGQWLCIITTACILCVSCNLHTPELLCVCCDWSVLQTINMEKQHHPNCICSSDCFGYVCGHSYIQHTNKDTR